MNLRQRGTLRPPRRFNDEDFVATSLTPGSTPHPQSQSETPQPRQRLIMPACARPTFPLRYVDYDPNLPPAAFPTLENPIRGIVKQKQQREAELRRRDKRRERDRATDGHRDEGAHRGSMEGVVDMDVDQVDRDAEESEEDEPVRDMETSDEEDDGNPNFSNVEYGISPADFQHVRWGDLSPFLQCEIIENLARVYEPGYIVRLLHLSPAEKAAANYHMSKRRVQAQKEAKILEEMRAKQLRALLRIDNSSLKQSRVPAQLVFRKLSKYYLRDTRAHASSDYLMSTAKEVIAAKCYLRRIGLDPMFAGEWRNELASIQQPPGTNPHEVDSLRWTLDSSSSTTAQDTVAAIKMQAPQPSDDPRRKRCEKYESNKEDTPKKAPRVQLTNCIGNLGAVNPPDSPGSHTRGRRHHVSISGMKTSPEIFGKNTPRGPGNSKNPITPGTESSEEKVVHVKIGPEGAARVDNKTEITTPEKFRFLPSPISFSSSSAPSSKQRSSSFVTQPNLLSRTMETRVTEVKDRNQNSSTEHTQRGEKPVERVLSGGWWYDDSKPSTVQSTAMKDSSKKLQARLFAARAEGEIRHLARSGSQNRPATDFKQMQLPIRGLPLMKINFRPGDGERPATPEVLNSDDPIMAISSPIKRDDSSQHQSQNKLTMQTHEIDEDATMGEDEHGPPYSPVTPPEVVHSALDAHAASIARSRSSYTRNRRASEATFHNSEGNTGRDEIVEAESNREMGETASNTQFLFGTDFEGIAGVKVASQGTGQSPRSSPIESFEENSQVPTLQETQLSISLSGVQSMAKPTRRTKPSVLPRKRKSARLNPTEARSLRPPKSNIQYKF